MERKINAAAFKAQCLKLIDEVAESGEPITITKRGKAKVQIVATALVQEAVLLTADQPILAWSGPVKRQDAQR